MTPWPEELDEVFRKVLTVSYASLTASGRPVTVPLTPYVGESGTLDVSTGLTYPAKAERARSNPKVALLFADFIGSGLASPPAVLVQGSACVRDSDLQANTDRYVRLSGAKLPESTKGQPRALLRRFSWYFARIWIEVTPHTILWWPGADLQGEPRRWSAERVDPPASDPAPAGGKPPAWLEPPADWREIADGAVGSLSQRDITVVGADGWPACLPVTAVERREWGFELSVPPAFDLPQRSPACLTFHDHPELFTGQENRTFIGEAEVAGDGTIGLRVERALADWSLPGNRLRMAMAFLSKGRRLAPRLAREAERRGQPIPKVRFPGEY